jgi:hypothetical protein
VLEERWLELHAQLEALTTLPALDASALGFG